MYVYVHVYVQNIHIYIYMYVYIHIHNTPCIHAQEHVSYLQYQAQKHKNTGKIQTPKSSPSLSLSLSHTDLSTSIKGPAVSSETISSSTAPLHTNVRRASHESSSTSCLFARSIFFMFARAVTYVLVLSSAPVLGLRWLVSCCDGPVASLRTYTGLLHCLCVPTALYVHESTWGGRICK
jgi:hypothetical protein